MMGDSCGRVMAVNCFHLPAPSTLAASYNSRGIWRRPARKMTIGEPNCHTCRAISVQLAVSGFAIQDIDEFAPNRFNSALNRPSEPNTIFHGTATATEPPSMDGR